MIRYFLLKAFILACLVFANSSCLQAEAPNTTSETNKEIKKGTYALSRFNAPKYPEDYSHFTYVNPDAPKGGRLRMSTIGSYDSLNKDIVRGIAAEGLLMTTDPLMKKAIDDHYSWYGLVAKTAELAPDYSAVTFYLDPRARFHDGTPITAEDVKFTLELFRDKGIPKYRKYFVKIIKIEILDPLTIKFTFEKDPVKGYDREIPVAIANLRPVSKKFFEGKDFQCTGLTPILGSGPYRVKEVDQGRKITYERVPDYWAADLPVNKGQNNFDRIEIVYFKNDQTLRESFKTGEIDVYFETSHHKWNTGYNFPAVTKGDIVKVELEHRRSVAVRTPIFNMKNPLFKDRNVRKAIALAFDFNHINKTHFHGGYKSMDSLFANTIFAPKGPPSKAELEILEPFKGQLDPEIYQDSIQVPDPTNAENSGLARRKASEGADQLLKNAGWIIQDGVRMNPKTGERFQFVFLIKDPQLEGMALAFKDSLKRLGIVMEVRRVDVTQYEKHAVEKTFDMIFHTWFNSMNPGVEQEYYFDPKAADQPGSTNYIGVKDPALFALSKTLSNATSRDDLQNLVKSFDRAVMGMYYMIPGFYDNMIRFAYWSDRLAYPEIDPDSGTNAPEWWWAK